MCTPNEALKKLQDENRMTELMVEQEAVKTLPFGDVWNEYCQRCGVPSDREFYAEQGDLGASPRIRLHADAEHLGFYTGLHLVPVKRLGQDFLDGLLETKEMAKEIVRCDGLDRVYMALDYFDASINRVSAWAMPSPVQMFMTQGIPVSSAKYWEMRIHALPWSIQNFLGRS